jgi:hypothetical protein
MKKIAIIAVLIMVVITGETVAGPDYISGNVKNYTAIQGGLMIMVDTGVPDNCAGTPYGWLIIAEADKAMLAMAFMRINQGNMGVTAYSDGDFYLGFCRVVQYDPAD